MYMASTFFNGNKYSGQLKYSKKHVKGSSTFFVCRTESAEYRADKHCKITEYCRQNNHRRVVKWLRGLRREANNKHYSSLLEKDHWMV